MTEEDIKRNKPKSEKYERERNEIIKRLNEIIGINEYNNRFILEDLKNNKDKQEAIKGLENEVRKYFAHSEWPYFRKSVNEETKSICLARSIYKSCNYDINYKQKMKNGIKYTEYIITKKHLGD